MKRPESLFRLYLFTLITCAFVATPMAEELLLMDERLGGGLETMDNLQWRMVTDGVMGGVSNGNLFADSIDGKKCLHLRGDVRLENNGGFIQAALDIQRTQASDASAYQGLTLEVYGNGEEYNLHLRTADVWLPWQSYRSTFRAPARWQTIRLPFAEFQAHRLGKPLDLRHLQRIGIVAIGREFTADLCFARLGLYRETD